MDALIPIHRLAWEQVVRNIHPQPWATCRPDSRHLSFEAKGLLFLIATYGDETGADVIVSDDHLCAITSRPLATVRRWRTEPVELGLLHLDRAMRPRQQPTSYHLTVPDNLFESVCMSDAYAGSVTPAMRAAVARRDGDRCRYCGTEVGPFEVDHVVPLSQGGLSVAENLVWACARCNRRKRAKTWTPDPLPAAVTRS